MAITIKCNVDKLPKPIEFPKPDYDRPINVMPKKKKRDWKLVRKGINNGVYGRPRFYTPAQDAVITELRRENKSYKEIGEQLGKSSEAIRRRWYVIRGRQGGTE